MTLKRFLLAWTALCGSLLTVVGLRPAEAADLYAPYAPPGTLPAVSGPNAKLDLSGGWLTFPGAGILNDTPIRVQGAVSLPLSHDTGFQVDGVVATIQNQMFGHAAAH